MSKPDDKDLPEDQRPDDKTIVQFAGARSNVWPEADEEKAEAEAEVKLDTEASSEPFVEETRHNPFSVSDAEPPSEAAEPTDVSGSDANVPIPNDTIWSHAPEPEATKADAMNREAATADATDPSPLLEPPSAATSDGQDNSTETGALVAETEPEALAREATGSANSETPVDWTEEDDNAAPPDAPRIEVPVQQQYASLLAALSDRIEQHPGGHDLLAVLRMLEGQTAPGGASSGMDPKKEDEPAPPRIGKSRRSMEDIVRFGQDPSSEFATSTIERATRDADGGLVLLERFLGLLGPQGGLPAPYTDEAIMRGLRGDDSFPRFLDVFNNRFVQLFFRAWADARPIVQHDRPDDDRFLAYLGSSIGTGAPIFRDLDRIDDRLKLLYAGLTAPKTKSAVRLKALITGVFGVKVEIDQCVGTWLHLDPDDQLQLGGFGPGGAGQLGADTIVGAKVYSVSDKIRIRIFTSSLDEYRKFLPPTRTKPNPWTEKLFDLIDFYLGLEIEYEIELALPKRCASSVRMDRNNSATLGHIGWLKPAAGTEPDDTEDDEEMLTDTRFRPVRRHTTVYQ